MKLLKKLIPQFSELLFIGVFIYIFIYKTYGIINSDTDMLWHIRQGEWLIDNKKIIIDREIFSYMFDVNNWKYLSWLSDIIYAGMYRIWGIGSIIVMTELLITGTIYMIFRYLCKKGVSVFISLPVIIVFMQFYSMHWLPRAVIFSYFFTALWFVAIDLYYSNQNKKVLYLLPLIQVIWTNMHSSFMYGYIIFFFFGLSALVEIFIYNKKEKIRVFFTLLIVGILTLFTSFINPYGATYFTELNSEAINFFAQVISEFQSINMHNSVIKNIYFVIMVFLIIFYGNNKKIAYIMLLIFWQYSGFEYIRHMALFGIITMLILPQLIKIPENIILKKIDKISQKILIIENNRYSLWLLIIIPVFFVFVGIKREIPSKMGISYVIDHPRFPVKAVEYLKKNPIDGNCFNDYFAGGYIIWEFYPKRLVSMDPRATVYPMELIIENYKINTYGSHTFKLLENKNIKWLFLVEDSFLAKALKLRSDLVEQKYSDGFYIIYELKKEKKWTDKKEVKGEKDGKKGD